MRILILGPQGSGKGTQARRIAALHDLPHVATGDILRSAIADGSELGLQVEPILERGDLVPDDLMVDLIRERLADEHGFVLDGFPRTVPQAEALDVMLDEIGKPLDVVLLLEVSDDVALERLLERGARGKAGRRCGRDPEPAAPVSRSHRAGGRALSVEGMLRGRRRRADDGRGLRCDRGCARRARGPKGSDPAEVSSS